MMGLVIALHVIICALLITIILIQRGRGSGLVESFSGVESMFGTKTSAFLSRTTTVLSILFFITCLSLAMLSAKMSRSLMRNIKAPKVEEKNPPVQTQAVPAETAKVSVPEPETTTQSTPATGESIKPESPPTASPAVPEATKAAIETPATKPEETPAKAE